MGMQMGMGMDWAGLGWNGAGKGWTGLTRAGLGWVGLGWTGLDQAGMGWTGLVGFLLMLTCVIHHPRVGLRGQVLISEAYDG